MTMTDDTTTTPPTRRAAYAIGILAVVAALLVGLGGGYALGRAGDDGSSGTTISGLADEASATDHDRADVTFATMMVPHHQQAVEMAALADTRAGSAEVKALAATIAAAQQPEIDLMTGWLADWGAPAPDSDSGMSGDMSGMDHGSGMMSQADMTKLAGLSGAAFDRTFLTMMIAHHQGAIDMARIEQADGESADALALAASISITQHAQVDQMEDLLDGD